MSVAILIGWVIHFALPRLDDANYWFIGLFAMGMLAAHLVTRGARIPHLGQWVSILVPMAFVGASVGFVPAHRLVWLSETLIGGITAALLVWLSQRKQDGTPTWAHRALESRFLVWVGLWSYSLYLIHSPLLGLANILLLPVQMPLVARFAIVLIVALPLSATIAYGFHRLVERRFMTSHQTAVRTELQASESPQPE